MSAQDIAVGAGQGVGAGLGMWAALRFVRWAVEFLCKRLDLRSERIDARERAIEEKFNSRLRHVEQELALYREATMRLVNRIAEIMPQDPVLGEVAKILRRSVPLPLPDEELEDLVRKAGGALDATD